MITEIEKVTYDFSKKDINIIEKCGNIILKDGLVVFPTETVYGLGANALSEYAVEKIYKAKGRPSDNPLIVHISKKEDVNIIAKNISKEAEVLMEKFWPGALTLILEKKNIVSNIVSGGLASIAVRIPSNNIARLLIEKSKVPIAAPSANISGKPSPTTAQHVIDDLNNKVDFIIDGGSCDIGIESTVIDMRDIPCILRPGSITIEMLQKFIGKIKIKSSTQNKMAICPGMKYKHYAPKAEIIIISGDRKNVSEKILELSKNYNKDKIGIISCEENKNLYNIGEVISLGSINNSSLIVKNLFKTLREFDKKDIDIIFSEDFSKCVLGLSIMDRIKKAANYNIIKV